MKKFTVFCSRVWQTSFIVLAAQLNLTACPLDGVQLDKACTFIETPVRSIFRRFDLLVVQAAMVIFINLATPRLLSLAQPFKLVTDVKCTVAYTRYLRLLLDSDGYHADVPKPNLSDC